MRIALLDDDPAQLVQLLVALKAPITLGERISCVSFSMGEALRHSLRRETFDILLLDWNVPDLDGTELLHWLRKECRNDTPVIMLSSRAAEKDVASALKIGADDYIVKPFRPLELRARIDRLVNRRGVETKDTTLCFGNWIFDELRQAVMVTSSEDLQQKTPVEINLTEREFQLALILFQNIGKPLSRNYLLEKSGYESTESPSRTLDSHIYRLRKKLALDGSKNLHLQTLYGRGYRLQAAVSQSNITSQVIPDF